MDHSWNPMSIFGPTILNIGCSSSSQRSGLLIPAGDSIISFSLLITVQGLLPIAQTR